MNLHNPLSFDFSLKFVLLEEPSTWFQYPVIEKYINHQFNDAIIYSTYI